MDSILLVGNINFIGYNLIQKLLLNTNIDMIYLLNDKDIDFEYKNTKIHILEGELQNIKNCLDICNDITLICYLNIFDDNDDNIINPYTITNKYILEFINLLTCATKIEVERVIYLTNFCNNNKLGKIINNMNEQFGIYFNNNTNLNTIGLRISNIYGIRQHNNFIMKSLNYINNNTPIIFDGNGYNLKDYIYVDDVVDSILLSLNIKNKNAFGNIFNIVSNKLIKDNDIIKEIFENTSKVIYNKKLNKNIINDKKEDIRNTANILKFKPKINYDEGINITINYYKNILENF
jgi:dTDP-D-glucose 4,6-dehydratase